MAEQVTITRLDDIDGSAEANTVHFGFENTNYEIDLNEANTAKLSEALAPFIEKARKVRANKPGRPAKAASTRSSAGEDLTAMREWAKANGYEVKERGRVPVEIREAYAAANSGASLSKKSDKKAEKAEQADAPEASEKDAA